MSLTISPPHDEVEAIAAASDSAQVQSATISPTDSDTASSAAMSTNLQYTGSAFTLHTHTPISRLPDEVLCLVFFWLKCHDQYQLPLRWLRVTWVCRQWRRAALSQPRLWAQIVRAEDMGAQILDLMFSRAKMAPVRITYDCDSEHPEAWDKLCDYIPKNISHVVSLDIGELDLHELVLELLQPAPLLEELLLDYLIPGVGNLPGNLFDGQAPRLKHLQLLYFMLDPLPPSVFNNLTSFLLVSSREETSLVLDALDTMPLLERLDLTFGLEEPIEESTLMDFQRRRKVPLVHLSELRIVSNYSHIFKLMDALDMPSQISLELRYHYEAGAWNLAEVPIMIQLLASHLRREESPIKTLTFQTFEYYSCSNVFAQASGSETDGDSTYDVTSPFEVEIVWPKRSREWTSSTLVELIVAAIPTRRLLELDLLSFQHNHTQQNVFLPEDFLRMLFRPGFKNLMAIQIPILSLTSFFTCLDTGAASRDAPGLSASESDILYCLPNLRVINVLTQTVANFEGPEVAQDVLAHAKPPSSLPTLLLNILRGRQSRGMPLHTIEFMPKPNEPSPDPKIWYDVLKASLEPVVHLTGPDGESYICGGANGTQLPDTPYVGCSYGIDVI
ncbi:hypothetical protein EVG20_g6691 [Dentipellis fragilis]|uniref:F-box domain-containing protein n=1 Tax=Dentipellis fragilis TaxID=205917 RepID=A0A4Y9YL09_9AGAM|nr:hypothetical protein EVG20_g6691 [Dentipellis fragilis]